MFQKLLMILFTISCTSKVVKKGGESPYLYDTNRIYGSEELKSLSENIITSFERNPKIGLNKDLFGQNQSPIRRIGIVVFETEIQPTIGGLAGRDKIYLTASGKQILTENFLAIWEQIYSSVPDHSNYVSTIFLKNSKSFHSYGKLEKDFVNSQRSLLATDDILFLEKGKTTTTHTVINPRGMRDLSLLMIPATELMGGPKWSEHQKHFINEVAQELQLDAVLIVMSKVNWTISRIDKQTGESVPEELYIKISASTLVPFRSYHERLGKIGVKDSPKTTICYRHYEGDLRIPISINLSKSSTNFTLLQHQLLTPLLEHYKNLSQMMIVRINEDLRTSNHAKK